MKRFKIALKIIIPFLLVPFMIFGCAEKTIYVDRVVKVNVPVPCKTKEVTKAEKRENSAVTLADILRERDELRAAVDGCR